MSISKIFYLLVILFISFIPIIDLFHSGLPLTHDGQDHLARIANFYTDLKEGNIIPRWAANLNWGYGHPILEFLYPLPSYIASLFHFLGFSLINSTKVVFGIGIIFSGITMFLWLSEFLSLPSAFIGGMLYVFAPYRFVDLYVRGDIGENLAFVFMPLMLFFIYRLYKQQKQMYIFGGAISFACLILSHNAISLMYFPFIVFYCVYLIDLSSKKKYLILNFFFLLLLGFGLSAFFWLPALFEGKYTLRNIVTAGEYKSRFISFQQLLYGPWSYGLTGQFTTQLGIINWIMFLLSFPLWLFMWKRKDKSFFLTGGLVIYTIIALFLMLSMSQFIWQKIILLQNFQFPWRFLAIPVFTTAVLGAFAVSHIPGRFQTVSIAIIILIILGLNKDYWHAKGFLQKPESFFTGIYDGTTDTGESSPIWSVRFMEHPYKAPLELIDGSASIKRLKRTSTEHHYQVNVIKQAQFLENTVYFPGWNIFPDNKKIAIEYQDVRHRGLMTFFVEKGKHNITVQYKETKFRFLADIISFMSILVITTLMVKTFFQK